MTRKQKHVRRFLCIEALEDRSCPASPGASTSLFGFGWADRAGSPTGEDHGLAIATDQSGDAYVTGGFAGTADFGPGPGATTLTSAGDVDIFLAKYSPAGAVLWVKHIGGPSSDAGRSLVVDGSGNVYLTGDFYQSAVFGAGEPNQATLTATGYNVFVAKLASDSGNLAWVRQYGGTGAFNYGNGLALDRGGDLYLTGVFSGDAAFGTNTLSSDFALYPQNSFKDGETFTVNDGSRSLTFEYDSGGGVAAGNFPIAFASTDLRGAIATATVRAVNAANAAGKTSAIAGYDGSQIGADVARAITLSYTPLDATAPSLSIGRAEGGVPGQASGHRRRQRVGEKSERPEGGRRGRIQRRRQRRWRLCRVDHAAFAGPRLPLEVRP